MRRVAVMLALVACKDDAPRSSPEPASEPTLRAIARLGDGARLVSGTRTFAVVDRGRWLAVDNGALVAKPAIVTVQADELFLGATPIAVTGEHHHEVHVRLPDRTQVPIDGIATQVVTLADGRELWRYEHELVTRVAFVRGATVEPLPDPARIGPDVEGMSPVSRRRCKHPQISDLDATHDTAYALVVECDPKTPLRVIAYPGARETRLERTFEPAVLAGNAVVGTRDGALAIARGTRVTTSLADITRVLDAVVAADGAIWVLAYTSAGAIVARDGVRVAVPQAPEQLAVDATLGVVVRAGTTLYAAR